MGTSVLEVDFAHHVGADSGLDGVQDLLRHGAVDGQQREHLAALGLPRHLHAGDVDVVHAQDVADGADHAGAVRVGHHHEVFADRDFDLEAVDSDELLDLLGPGQGSGHGDLAAVAEGAAQGQDVAVGLGVRGGDQPDVDAALLGDHGGVDVGDLLGHDVGEDALERGEFEDLDVQRGDLAGDLDVELGQRSVGHRGEDPAQLLDQRDAGAHVRGDHAAGDVHGVGHQLAGQGLADGLGDRDAGLFLGLVGGGAQVRGDHHVVELEERQVGAGFLDEHVDAGAGDLAGLQRGVERFLVHQAAAGDVDDVRGALHLLEGLGAEHADGLRASWACGW